MTETLKAISLSIVLLLATFFSQSFAGQDALEREAERVVSPYTAFFQYPPKATPNKTIVDGPLMGNGDMGVCIAAVKDAKRFWLCKNDFWKLAADHPSGPSGPRVFGGIDIALPGYGGGWPGTQSLYDAVTVMKYPKPKRPETNVEMRAWVSATENILVIELTAAGDDAQVEVKLWTQEGNGSEVAGGEKSGTRWATREFARNVEIPTEVACAMKAIGADNADSFTVKAGETVVIVAAMQSAFKSKTCLDDVRKRIDAMDSAALAELKKKHAAWWSKYWAESFVEIGDPLLEQRYYLSNYVMACASRER